MCTMLKSLIAVRMSTALTYAQAIIASQDGCGKVMLGCGMRERA